MRSIITALALAILAASIFVPAPARASGVPTQIVLSAPSTRLNEGEPMQIVATMQDDTGATLTGYTFVWSATLGAITGAGVYTPRATGIAHVTATSSGLSATIDITVTNFLAVQIVNAPSFAFLAPISGVVRVTTVDGRPLAGADVVVNIRNTALGPAQGMLPESIAGKSGAGGSFRFAPTSLQSTLAPTRYVLQVLVMWHGNYVEAQGGYTIQPPVPLPSVPSVP